MGCEPMFLCFKNQSPNCMVLTGLASCILAFAFMIWGLADLEWFKKGVEAIYIISFIFLCFCLLSFIYFFIVLNLRKDHNYRAFNNIGRILCLCVLVICLIAFIFLLVATIIIIVDYADLENDVKGQQIPSHDWAAVFVPSIFGLASFVIMAFVANILYRVFYDNMASTPYPVNITQNSMTTTPNIPQPEIIPNNGPVPQMGNNIPYPVPIQQSGINLNK